MNGIASFSGLATGLDTASLVTELVRAESIPIQRLRVKQANHDSMGSRFGTIRNRLNSMKDAIEAITEGEENTKVRSSDEDFIRATSLGTAAAGTYAVEVTALASAERTHSDGVAAKDTAGLWADGSSIGITVGTDAEISINVSSTDTLASVAQRINDSDARVTADVIFDGSEYRLQVSGNDTGLENAVTFTETGLDLGLTDPANETVAAADAAFTVDGLPMTRSSNEVAEAIPGVSLDLEAVTSGPVNITVGADSSTLVDQVQKVVDEFNSVVNGINVESIFQGQARTGDSLSGDSTLRSLQSALSNATFTDIPGFDTLQQLGIETTQAGALEFDKEAFLSALNDDEDAVLTALKGTDTETGLLQAFDSVADQYAEAKTGLLSQRIDNFATENRRIDDRIEAMQVRIDKFEEGLRSKFAALETLVSGLNSQGQQMLAVLGGL